MKPLSLLHVSDLHLGPHFIPAAGEAMLRFAHARTFDHIVVSGDFTQRAKPEQFALARELLDKLPETPVTLVPGNHDIPMYRLIERLLSPFRLYEASINENRNTVYRADSLIVVGLDSTSPYRALTNGRVTSAQLELCRHAFEAAEPETVRIVVAHHHFVPVPDYAGGEVVPGAKEALDAFASLHVDLILGGHLHRAFICNSLDAYPGRDRDRGVIVVSCGTTTSQRGRGKERERNSLNTIEVDEQAIEITHYLHFEAQREFLPVSRHRFARPRFHWL